MNPDEQLERRISGIAALDQPLRRDLYRLLRDRDGWVARDEAASALGVPRSVAAFHLDKLVDAGVVEVTFERTTGRTGPGAGRPSKFYRRRDSELTASVPERKYDLAGSLLADRDRGSRAHRRTDRRMPECHGSRRRKSDRRGGGRLG